MERAASARRLTLALAGRAAGRGAGAGRAVHPLEGSRLLLDVAGGSGLYAIAYLLRHPELHAIVWDRPEVLKVAHEMAVAHGVADRLGCMSGDMFRDTIPAGADAILLSNVLHDWDAIECWNLISKMLPFTSCPWAAGS